MTTITWGISQLNRNASDGGVVEAYWFANAVDGAVTASLYGSVNFTPDASSPDFKPYDTLTEADILAWVWGAIDRSEIEAGLEATITAKKHPTTLSGLPW